MERYQSDLTGLGTGLNRIQAVVHPSCILGCRLGCRIPIQKTCFPAYLPVAGPAPLHPRKERVEAQAAVPWISAIHVDVCGCSTPGYHIVTPTENGNTINIHIFVYIYIYIYFVHKSCRKRAARFAALAGSLLQTALLKGLQI